MIKPSKLKLKFPKYIAFVAVTDVGRQSICMTKHYTRPAAEHYLKKQRFDSNSNVAMGILRLVKGKL